jgi:uncharacterized protein YaaQ
MKMLIAILNEQDGESVLTALVQAEFRATRIASTGAFLRRGNTTLLIGLDDEKVDEAIEVIRQSASDPVQPGQRRATVFVLDVARFEQL